MGCGHTESFERLKPGSDCVLTWNTTQSFFPQEPRLHEIQWRFGALAHNPDYVVRN
jgi:hypothetical protein